ncbi:penicillin-binding protein 1A [Hydrogenophaga sp. BPS33]|uniref:penicillin-binding protein 1A n=1 Tax=Hydrogenophaga sp. BPS33 TaxID=2651974 RepID=UPI00131FC087|nr:PBP1A family penicillin-binding protein [Hydrogenophaga sp. BPS33]QHE87087.1 PBP1A family penicillin-binding protein [Hydrogenophaga sp. BPS33]
MLQKPILRRTALALAVTAAVVVALPVPASTFDMPSLERIVHYQPKLPLQVFTADGVEIAQFGTERREYMPISRIPKQMQQAVLAVEDARFREHSGVDPKGMARAVVAAITGGRRQGASTITQQLVRTMLLTHQFSAERKAKEIWLALKLEDEISKDRILEIYMNEIFLGQRAYGFAAASQIYFGKPLDKLSLAETAMLAGLPQNPYYANPVANFERATQRQRVVLDRMRATEAINDQQLATARAEKLVIRAPGSRSVHAAHVAEMARLAVVERFGTEAYSSGIRVTTSLRAADQRAAHNAVQKGVLALDRRGAWRGPEDLETLPSDNGAELERAAAEALKDHRDDEDLRVGIVLSASPKAVQVQLASGERVTVQGAGLQWVQRALDAKAKTPVKIVRGSIVRVVTTGKTKDKKSDVWAISQWPEIEAAMVSLDPQTGRVRALVGGFDFAKQPFNHVTQGWRQPGSALKPLLYSAALEARVMPATLVDDLPFTAANGWSPTNSNGQYEGPITLRHALMKSSNLASVRVLQHTGTRAARDWTARFGLDPARQPDDLSLALGTGSVTPLQMAQAYATVANGGWQVAPVVIEKITDAQGKVLFEAPPAAPLSEESRAIPARNAFVLGSLLNDVTRSGTAARAQALLKRPDIYGKTGTTNDAVDAWFAGYQPSLAAAVWVGYDKPRSLGGGESGGRIALPIWIDYMGAALKGVPVAQTPAPPDGLVREGDDWLYAEWRDGGWVSAISDSAGVQYQTNVGAEIGKVFNSFGAWLRGER